MAHRPSAKELESAAREVWKLLHFGYLKGRRGTVADLIEPLLRHYILEYRPRIDLARRDRDRCLASAAWQVLWASDDTPTLRQCIKGVQSIRREWDPADRWPADRDALIREVRRIRTHRPRRGKAPSELSRAGKLFELLAEGFVGQDARRGVRPERAALLRDARSTAILIVTGKVT